MKARITTKKLFVILLIFNLFPLFSLGQNIYQQVNNSGFENYEGSGNQFEPVDWNSFGTAQGSLSGSVNALQLEKTNEKRPGSSGSHSVRIFARSVFFIPANANLTTGRINAASIDMGSDDNHNLTKRNETGFNHPFGSLPDSITVWIKFIPGGSNNKNALVGSFIHNDHDFKALPSGNYDYTQLVGYAAQEISKKSGNPWQRISFPYRYGTDCVGGNCSSIDPRYMLINFTTCKTAGGGHKDDQMYIDDIELIYNKTIATNNPSATEYVIGSSGQAISTTYNITGAMFPNTTLQLQLSNNNGSFSNPTVLGSATTGGSIISGSNSNRPISGTIPTTVPPGTGYRVRVVTTNNYIVTGSSSSSNITIKYAAPTNVAVSFNAGNCHATLTWTAPPNASGAKYNIYKNGTRIASDVSTTSYTDNNVTANTTYQYCVTATGNGTESAQACVSGMCAQVFTIAASATGQGTITPSGNVQVNLGESQTFTFASNNPSIYELKRVLVDGTNDQAAVNAGSYTFNNVSAPHTIVAEFGIKQYQITASATGSGTIAPSGNVMVNHGGEQTFTFTPNQGATLTQVLVDGVNNTAAVAAGSYKFANVTAPHTIQAVFTASTYTIAATAGANGTITPSGNVSVTHGEDKTFTITPNTGYEIDRVVVDGDNNANAVATGSYTFSNVVANHTIAATFKVKTFTINAVAGEGGRILPGGESEVNYGENKTYTIEAYAGYDISEVLIDGVNNPAAVASGSYTFTNITANHTITASFTGKQYVITATAEGAGSINPQGAISVSHGGSKEFIFTPNAGHKLAQVLINGVNNPTAVANGRHTFSNVTGDQTINAVFEIIKYTITATAGAGGTINPAGAVEVEHGNNQSFTIVPNSGYVIDKVFVDNVNNEMAVTAGSYTFSDVTANHTIAATFKVKTFTINAIAGEGGRITPSGLITANQGEDKSFSIETYTGYDISELLIDGVHNQEAAENGHYTFYDIAADHSIEARFTKRQYTITATAEGAGSIDPQGAVSVLHGENKKFVFTPDAGYKVSQVLINGVNNPTAVANREYTFNNVTGNHTIKAVFEIIKYTIAASAGAGGTIAPSGAVEVEHGGSKVFTIVPNSGYLISSVKVDNEPDPEAAAAGSYTFNNITGNHTISAEFELIKYQITASAGAGGTISPSGNVFVDHGRNQAFTFTPDEGFAIEKVFVDGVENALAAINGSYTFVNVTETHQINVVFLMAQFTITASAGTYGTINPSGAIGVARGDAKEFTITPDLGYVISEVLVDGVNNETAIAAGSYTFYDIESDHTIAADFAFSQYVFTPAVAGSGGTIEPADISLVTPGDDITFYFIPDVGHKTKEVRINDIPNPEAAAAGFHTFENVSSNFSVVASFEMQQFTITASCNEGGNISPSGATTLFYGNAQSYTIAPDEGYIIAEVKIDGENNAAAVANGSYTFSNVTENHTIEAVFEKIVYIITATANAGGSISPSGEVAVEYGEDQLFVITPVEGATLTNVLVDGAPNAEAIATGTYLFSDVTDNHTIVAEFTAITYQITASVDGLGGAISPSGTITVVHGASQTFAFTPDAAYRILSVLIDGENNPEAVATGEYTFEDISAPHSIVVSFEMLQYTITASVNGTGGSINPSGTVTLNHGASQTFNFTPVDGYQIASVLIDGTENPSAAENGNYLFSNVMEDHTIEVAFEIITYTITATAGTGGSISPAGTTTVNHGSDQTYTITAAEGFTLTNVLVDGAPNAEAIATGTHTFSNVVGNHTIAAEFTAITYSITASVDGTGGVITPSGTITVTHGASQTFTFTPDGAYRVAEVLIDGANNPTAVTNGTYTFSNITAAHTIVVSFEMLQYTITASVTGSGGSIEPSGTVTLNHGASQTFNFTPDEGYQIATVLIDGTNNPSAVSSGTYAFNNVTANHTIAVSFSKQTFTISASVYGDIGGSITPSGTVSVEYDENQTFTIATDDGFLLKEVLVDGVNNPAAVAANGYTFTNVTAPHTIEAVFEKLSYTIAASAVGNGGAIIPEGDVVVIHGNDQTFSFIVFDGYEISEVLIDGTNHPEAVAAGEYTFTNVAAPHTIKVVFTQLSYVITASVDGMGGTITPQGATTVMHGNSQIFHFTANEGYKIAKVMIDGIESPEAANQGSYTFENVTENHTITVRFEKQAFIITARVAGGEGRIDPAGEIAVEYDENQTFNIIPAENFFIKSVLVDGVDQGAIDNYTFFNVAENHEIVVSFTDHVNISEIENSAIQIYPNPTSGGLRIRNEELGIRNVRVFDMTGRLIQEINNINSTELEVDLTNFAKGVYFINVDGKTMKVVKQ